MNVKYPHDIRISEGDGEEIIGYKAFKNLIRSGAVKRI
jgi:hypothetical protein